MTDITVRPATADDYPAMVRTFVDVVGQVATDEDLQSVAGEFESERGWVAEADGRIVGSAAAHAWQLVVPGGAGVSFAGLTLVAVLPSHHRRGVGTELMRHYAEDCRARGMVLGGLFSSDAGIYARFGFGVATRMASIRIDRERAHLAAPTTGRIEWLRLTYAQDTVREVFERHRATSPGEIVRTNEFWRSLFARWSGAAAPRPAFVAMHYGADGVVDGYAVHRIDPAWVDHTANNTAYIMELVGADTVRLELWKFLLQLEGVHSVVDRNARVDEPLPDVLADGRQCKVSGIYDQLWLRIFDVEKAMTARTYGHDGSVTFRVIDPRGADPARTYALEVVDGVGRCVRSDAAADVTLTPRALASTFLGDRSVRALAAASLVEVHDARAVARLDAMVAVEPKPQCLSLF